MRILLATDGSECARKAAEKCRELVAGLDQGSVRVITVVDNFTPMATEPFISPEEFLESVEQEMRENAERIVSQAVETVLSANNENIETEKRILIGSAKRCIVNEAEEWKADLIVVGSHGYGALSRVLLGSVSDAVVHHAPCSVLIVKKSDG